MEKAGLETWPDLVTCPYRKVLADQLYTLQRSGEPGMHQYTDRYPEKWTESAKLI